MLVRVYGNRLITVRISSHISRESKPSGESFKQRVVVYVQINTNERSERSEIRSLGIKARGQGPQRNRFRVFIDTVIVDWTRNLGIAAVIRTLPPFTTVASCFQRLVDLADEKGA